MVCPAIILKQFGSSGGHLAEPQTAERSIQLNTYAQEVLNKQSVYFIGYDDLGHGQGNFRYSSTDSVSSITGKGYESVDGASGEHCAGFLYRTETTYLGYVDDVSCEDRFVSICEAKAS